MIPNTIIFFPFVEKRRKKKKVKGKFGPFSVARALEALEERRGEGVFADRGRSAKSRRLILIRNTKNNRKTFPRKLVFDYLYPIKPVGHDGVR